MATKNYFKVRGPKREAYISTRGWEEPTSEEIRERCIRILGRRPRGLERDEVFFFDHDPTVAWGLALAAAKGDRTRISIWRQTRVCGPWTDTVCQVGEAPTARAAAA